jgi:hypothetical protein
LQEWHFARVLSAVLLNLVFLLALLAHKPHSHNSNHVLMVAVLGMQSITFLASMVLLLHASIVDEAGVELANNVFGFSDPSPIAHSFLVINTLLLLAGSAVLTYR